MSRLIKSFGFAASGIRHTFKTQPNFRIHTVFCVLVVIAGLLFKLTAIEWLWILAAISMVLVSELLNTAIEALVDLVSPEYNKKAGIVKDVAAGAVFIAASIAVVIGLIIFLPKFL